MRLIFAPGVRAQMQYIARDNERAADEVFAEIEALAEMLTRYPHMGPKISRSRRRRLTMVPHPYLIYYEVVGDAVRILASATARDFAGRFRSSGRLLRGDLPKSGESRYVRAP